MTTLLTFCSVFVIVILMSSTEGNLHRPGGIPTGAISINSFSNTWAVKVSKGGLDRVEERANKRHNLVNKGQIGNLKNTYLFELVDGAKEEMKEITQDLDSMDEVVYVEQQKYQHHVVKN